jgi:L-fuconate dehydratase
MRRPVDLYRRLTGDSQLRWVGPEKGVIHLAAAAVINAVWDLWARVQGKPVWRLVGEMSPEEFVASVDFRYLADSGVIADHHLDLFTYAETPEDAWQQILAFHATKHAL